MLLCASVVVALGWTRNVDKMISEYIMYLKIMQHFEGLYHGAVTHVIFEKVAANPDMVGVAALFRRMLVSSRNFDFAATNRSSGELSRM